MRGRLHPVPTIEMRPLAVHAMKIKRRIGKGCVMKSVKILFTLAALVALCASSDGRTGGERKGTGTIKGAVLDAETKEPLAFANVIVLGTRLGAMVGQDGRYEIKSVPEGRHTVKAMMMGYETGEKHHVKVRRNKATEVTFLLKETIVLKTQEIVVTGERPMVDVTVSSGEIQNSGESIREMPVDDVMEALALKTGIVKTGDQLHVRGGRSDETQYLLYDLNGKPIKDSPGDRKYSRPVHPRATRSAILRNSERIAVEPWNREQYDQIYENDFREAIDNPFSTFSVDVDAASYSNVRRFLRSGQLPPVDAIRIEELVNYFTYDYDEPAGEDPFSIITEVSACPWNEDNRLVHIGLQGRHIDMAKAPPCNLVFLLDVSGSMMPANKLPLLQKAFVTLTENLRREDRVAIVVYASSAAVKLKSTRGDDKERIIETIESLYACGSTAGGAGIQLAYDIAEDNYIEGGNNRVILATDGDFNTGISSDGAMVQLVEKKKKSGIFLTVLGFGEANLQDAKLEKIADHGNGHYAYIDDIFEARKVLVNELSATLFTIAKDVKIQVEFNPAKVESYRLIGYENRLLAKQDFENDKKDAGEIGAGHSVTGLYEIVPATGEVVAQAGQKNTYTLVSIDPGAYDTEELLTVRFRYKAPDEDESRLIEQALVDRDTPFDGASVDFRFAAAVAEFGMLLRDSEYKGQASCEHVLRSAKKSMGKDEHGYRHEFVRLVEMCREIVREVE
jgi:Ca-activated chloride channel family protein